MQIDKEKQRYYRSILFKHQDGIVITAVISALANKGVFSYLKEVQKSTLENIHQQFPFFHKGYLNIALRSLASQGVLNYAIDSSKVQIGTGEKFTEFLSFVDFYSRFNLLYSMQVQLLKAPISDTIEVPEELISFATELGEIDSSSSYFKDEVYWHLEAILLLPYLVKMSYNASYLDTEKSSFIEKSKTLFKLFKLLKLVEGEKLNDRGKFLVTKSYAYGVTVSYWPIFSNMEAYLYGDFEPFFIKDEDGIEQHVLRSINVWGSGGSHATYFKKFDEVILEIFNQPLEKQPKGIIDVGCGNGALLEHVFDLIWNKTSKKLDIKDNKLILVGADYNKEALLSTQRNLEKADILVDVIWGDIGNPEELNQRLKEKYQVALSDLLNIRSFLDHNRPFNFPEKAINFVSNSTGAFAHRGMYLTNEQVEQSLAEHFEKWKPYIRKHGLLMIELHTVDSNKVRENLGRTPCTAYDVTHGFSDQYIVEVKAFYKSVEMAGLSISKDHRYVFPNTETPTVSINLIK